VFTTEALTLHTKNRTRDFRSMDWKHLRGSRTESSGMRTEGALWNPSRGGSSSKRREICFYESELNL